MWVVGGVWSGERAVLSTLHDKGRLIAPVLEQVGVSVAVVAVDTDVLGTFSGEVPRRLGPLETAVAKARLGMVAAGCELGLASEGMFGPHSDVPWLTVDRELVVLVDDRRGLTLVGGAVSEETVAFSRTVAPGDDLERVVAAAAMPEHAVVVRPASSAVSPGPVGSGGLLFKAVRSLGELERAVRVCADASADGRAEVLSDLRAMCSPSRRRVIVAAAQDLAGRMGSLCPACACPGWGSVGVVSGLKCSWCLLPTDQVRAYRMGCVRCDHCAERPVELEWADPARCGFCNP